MKCFSICVFLIFAFFCADFQCKKTNYNKNEKNLVHFKKPTPRPTPKVKSIFYTKNNTITYGQFGSTTVLHCHVINDEANITVEWWKDEAKEPISSNFTVLGVDKRFIPKKLEDSNHWMLRIKYTREHDKGTYFCKVRGEKTGTLLVHVKVKHAYATIIGSKPRELRIGFPLRLSCVLKRSIEPPAYIFWYKDDTVINYDLREGVTIREGRQGTELIIPRAERHDAGNYSCVPSNADQDSVIVDCIKKVVAIDNVPEDEE